MNPTNRFLVAYLAFLLVVGGGFWAFNQFADPQYVHKYGWFSFALFTLVTGVIHIFLLRAAEKDPKAFVRGFMMANTVKIFIYLGFLVVFVLFSRNKAAIFIAQFAAFYFVFTAFEVSLLYKHLRPKK